MQDTLPERCCIHLVLMPDHTPSISVLELSSTTPPHELTFSDPGLAG